MSIEEVLAAIITFPVASTAILIWQNIELRKAIETERQENAEYRTYILQRLSKLESIIVNGDGRYK